MPKQTLSANNARAALLHGVNAVADPVKVTLGPRGRNVMLDRPGQPLSTRDGVTVAKEVSDLPNRFENMGAALAREVADAAVTEAGDGTTTATVLLQAIVTRGIEAINNGFEPLQLADGILDAAKCCAEHVAGQAIDATDEIVEQVAIISTHGDEELGRMIAKATVKIGQNGVIELAESRTHETTIEHLEGFYFERGWRDPKGVNQFFTNDASGQRCILNEPYILLSERMIIGSQNIEGDHIFQVLLQCVQARRPLLVIAEDLTGDALQILAANVTSGTIPGGCFVKLPGYGENKAAVLHDLQIAIGARRVHTQASTHLNDQLSSFKLEDLGTCKQAIISPTRTVLVEGAAEPRLLQDRVKQLIYQSQESTNPFDKEQLDRRIARLTGGVAVLRVGANSEPAMIEKKARAEDAVHACRGAMQKGVVPGGGVALLRASADNSGMADETLHTKPSKDYIRGVQLLLQAMREPAMQIIRNTGINDPSSIVHKIERMSGCMGYDAGRAEFCDLFQAGVVDPTKVVLTSLSKAASIGALLLTTEALITDEPKPPQPLTMSNLPPIYRP